MAETTPEDSLIGRLVAGRYRVLKLLGAGGMGQVYLAEHEAIEKKVALKVLRAEYSRKEDIVTRFQQEAISASRIKHPNVLDVFDFGRVESGEAFLAMEFLEGHDLADELAKRGVLDPPRAIPIALQICRALGAAHSRGVVHRDLKPDNVFLQRTIDGDELVKIVDFGIAQLRSTEEVAKAEPSRRRLTKTGMIFGTPEYMAPEQAAGRPADLRVDVYALGVILYEMFTGAVPFTGDSFMAVLAATLNQTPPPMRELNPDLHLSAELEALISRALAKNPAERFESMSALAVALVATPEGGPFASMLQGSIGEARSVFPRAPAAPTAAQFGGKGPASVAPTAVMPKSPPTAVLGTPAADRKGTPEGQASSVAPAKKTSPLMLGGAVLAVTALAAGGYLRSGPKPLPAPATAASGEHSPAVTAVIAAPPAPVAIAAPASAAPSASANEASNDVTLHVVTVPPGAIVLKSGFQVCDGAPCDVTVARNEAVELEARKGAARAQAKILAQQDQTVTMALASAASKPKPPTPRLCEVTVGELKVLRPCPN
jgi:serine/threonine-protein kinase